MASFTCGISRRSLSCLPRVAAIAFLTLASTSLSRPALSAEFPAVIALSSLDGNIGFRLDGVAAADLTGFSVAGAGDVNGDGFDDIVIGAPGGDKGAGETYVAFGKAANFASAIALASLDGSTGFRLDGIFAFDNSGRSVASAGDVNGDGFADLIIGAATASTHGDYFAGESYLVFGRAGGYASAIDLGSLNGSNGFRLDGIDTEDRSGYSAYCHEYSEFDDRVKQCTQTGFALNKQDKSDNANDKQQEDANHQP